MPIDLGDVYPLTVETRNAAGALENAGSVTLTIGLPDGTTLTPAVTNTPPGRYQVDYLTTMAGRHTVSWQAAGANASAYTDVFNVSPADDGALVSVAEVKKHLNTTLTVDDEELRSWIPAATPMIEDHTGKVVVRRTVVERHTVCWASELWLHHRPVISLTSIGTVDGSTSWPVTSSHVDIDADMGLLTLLSGSRWNGRLKIAQVAGMQVVPANYSRAAALIVAHMWDTQRQPGIGPAPTPFDTQTQLGAVASSSAPIPPRALALLGPRPPMVA